MFERELVDYIGQSADSPFGKWMTRVNDICESNIGLSIFDCDDMAYRDAFENGVRPSTMFARLLIVIGG